MAIVNTTGQAVNQLPTTKWHRNPQTWVALLALLINFVALVIRPEFGQKVGQLLALIQGAIARMMVGIKIAPPHIDTSYDPVLAKMIYAVQWATILAFVIIHRGWLKAVAARISGTMPIAQVTLKQFTNGWLALWYGWLVLYGWFFLTARPSLHFSAAVGAVSDVLDTASGFAVWWCFLVLDLPSVNIQGEPHRDRYIRRAVSFVAASGAVCALLGVADNLFDLNHFGVVVGVYNALAWIIR